MEKAGAGRDEGGVVVTTLGGTKVAGNPDLIQGVVGVYQEGGGSGDVVPFRYRGVAYAKKRAGTGLGWTQFQKLYYRSGGPDLTTASTGNVLAGWAYKDAAATDTYGYIYLPASGALS